MDTRDGRCLAPWTGDAIRPAKSLQVLPALVLEILPQMFRITGFEWASGFFYNPLPPELAASYLSPGLPV